MLKLENICFSYKNSEQQFCYDFNVKQGEIAVIMGASGVGKSTLLDLIAGFLIPNSGEILFENKNISNLAPQKRPISILFQSDNLFDHLSVNKNLSLSFEKNLSNKEQVAKALSEVGLAKYGEQKVSNLSGGQKQRIALARTLLRNKPILLLDEPFASLDEQSAKNMRNLLKQLVKKHNWHTIIVSHNRLDAAELEASIYQMENGKIIK